MYLGSKMEGSDGEYELTDLEIQQLKEHNQRKVKRVVAMVAICLTILSLGLVALSLALGKKIDLMGEFFQHNECGRKPATRLRFITLRRITGKGRAFQEHGKEEEESNNNLPKQIAVSCSISYVIFIKQMRRFFSLKDLPDIFLILDFYNKRSPDFQSFDFCQTGGGIFFHCFDDNLTNPQTSHFSWSFELDEPTSRLLSAIVLPRRNPRTQSVVKSRPLPYTCSDVSMTAITVKKNPICFAGTSLQTAILFPWIGPESNLEFSFSREAHDGFSLVFVMFSPCVHSSKLCVCWNENSAISQPSVGICHLDEHQQKPLGNASPPGAICSGLEAHLTAFRLQFIALRHSSFWLQIALKVVLVVT